MMTRKEAEMLIAGIVAGEVPLDRKKHFTDKMLADGFGIQDVFGVLRAPSSMTAPQLDEEHRNYKVEIVGKDMDGRRTKVVVGLRSEGPCVGITIMLARVRARGKP